MQGTTKTAASESVISTQAQHTPGPWEFVPSNENHGPYVVNSLGSDICDCYTMSNPLGLAICNGGDSRPIPFQHEKADANARLIAAAPDMLDALKSAADRIYTSAPAFEGRADLLNEIYAALSRATGQQE